MLSIVGVSSLKGTQHHFNEDRYRLLGSSVPIVRAAGRGEIYAVMDGVGGAPLGRRTAQHIADRLVDCYRLPATTSPRETLREILTAVNREVFGWGLIEGSERPLGAASMTVVWLTPTREAMIFHVGDTLAVQCSGKTVHRLTRDHSEGRGLRRYVGQGDGFTLDEIVVQAAEGDVFCLVTDGVTKVMSVSEVTAVLDEIFDAQRAADEITHRARGKGSPDDITAVVVQIEDFDG